MTKTHPTSIKNLTLLFFSFLFFCTSCTHNCYEIIEVKEIKYDTSDTPIDSTVSPENRISEKMIDYENDNLNHIFNDDYSLSSNYFGVEIIERKSNRRYVKRTSDKFEEQMRYEDNPFVSKPISTGKQKSIGPYLCDEYILKSEARPALAFYVTEEFPFTYIYGMPHKFPGFVVSTQKYAGQNEIIETIYDIRKVKCDDNFKASVSEVKEIESQTDSN